jgi:pterin-4a-carbinolamine dehydratase
MAYDKPLLSLEALKAFLAEHPTHDAGGLTSRAPRVAAEADRLFDEVCKTR